MIGRSGFRTGFSRVIIGGVFKIYPSQDGLGVA